MAINSYLPIHMGPGGSAGTSVADEYGWTPTFSMGDATRRAAVGVPSGTYYLSQWQGKSNRVTLSVTITTDTQDYILQPSGVSGYSGHAGTADVTLTINSGVNLYPGSTANAGLRISGFTSGDSIKIINNGTIWGAGAAGGDATLADGNGHVGGDAVALSFAIDTFTNNGAIYGGGGGGGASNCGCCKILLSVNHGTGGNGGGAGAGWPGASGGPPGFVETDACPAMQSTHGSNAGGNTSNGSTSGAAGGVATHYSTSWNSDAGGAGGNIGVAGSHCGTTYGGGFGGGAAGYAVRKNSYSCPTPGGTVAGTVG